ncbi:AEC family transporter [Stappia indica]|uniref:AEC family transporter n=1 Tax=Stappia indica TaxID=538381 RepID=UPI001CD36AA2|nr:AEC family transporter [Stappia indica]MCA1300400.1 AEC family transporter [Stappia indica]
MSGVLNALIPVLLVIAAGHVVARMGLITGDQWRGIEKITYFLLFPAIIISNVARTDFMALPAFGMSATLVLSILAMAALGLALQPLLRRAFAIDGPRFTSIFQGAIRWNTFVALAIADELLGADGVALLAVAIVAMVPLLNVICVLVLSRFASGSAPGARKLILDLLKNPFIWSTGLGLLLNISGLPLPGFAWSTLTILGSAALPIGIVCVGAGLDLNALRRPGPALTTATLLKLLVMPAFGLLFASLIGLEGPARIAVLIALSVPSAGGSFLLARQMGGDAKLMAEILTLQTLAAALTMPLVLLLAV